MNKDARIYVAGHRGLVGSAVVAELQSQGYSQVLVRTHAHLDLEDLKVTEKFFLDYKPEFVFMAAAKVGGIYANNTQPVDFLLKNLNIQNNLISSAYKSGVKRLLFLGSSCIYPRDCPQPIKEEYLLTGPLEPTNRPYALAKIAGVELCWAYNRQFGTNYFAAMPTNMYGPGDNYDLKNSHVLPALIRKMHEAKVAQQHEVVVWGSGTPLREFLFSSDLGAACVYLMNLDDTILNSKILVPDAPPLVNVGYGSDISISNLAATIARIVGFQGKLVYDDTKPNGTLRKLMDSSKIHGLGWQPKISLEEGIALSYNNFLDNLY